jgi:formate hydrogenlyase transcriptional activator
MADHPVQTLSENSEKGVGELMSSDADLRASIDAVPELAWCNRPDGSIEFTNRRWYDYTGLSCQEAHGSGWKAAIHPEDLLGLIEKWDALRTLGKPGQCEVRVRRSDGTFRQFLLRCLPLRDATGSVVRWFGTAVDIENRQQKETLRVAEKQTLAMIANDANLRDILNHLCSCIDGQVWPSVTTVLLMDPDGTRLWQGGGPLVPPGWICAINPVPVAVDAGLCGTAAFLKARVVVNDVATEPNWHDEYRGIAIRSGIRAAWSAPILNKDNQVLGTFALYCSEPCVPTEADLALIEGAGRVALIAIERRRSQVDLRRALDEIRKSEAKLRQIIDTIPSIAWCNLPDGSNEFLNQRWHDYSGLSPQESRGSGWKATIHPEDLPRVLDKWSELLGSGEPGEVEGRMRRYDGEYRWFLFRAEPFRDEVGNIVRWYGTSTDIESLKQIEENLREDERELRRITDAIPQAIVVQDPRGVPLYANQATLNYTGLAAEDVVAPGFRERIFHPEDIDKFKDQRTAALARGIPFELEQRALSKDGEYRWFLIRYNPFRDESDRIVRWYATGTDIHDRVKAEERTRNENLALREQIDRDSMFEDIVGSSEALRKVLRQVAKVAPSDSTVLILGETGTGKELIARAIHKRSKRAQRAFIGVNCAAIPPSLIASELFGYEKGAFTGATQRRLGRFESANGGTIFLDEVGDFPQEIQIALLRVLQEREIQRVGNSLPISVDLRVLAATHRDLDALVAEGKFREDLLYRLNVVPIEMPSLRERAADLPLLVEYFIARFGKKAGKKFRAIDDRTLKLFHEYSWPGNVRELQNVIERAVILSDGDIFSVDETWLKRRPSRGTTRPAIVPGGMLHSHEKEKIEAALEESHGRISGARGAAVKLGLPARTLDSKIKRLGINQYRFKVPQD